MELLFAFPIKRSSRSTSTYWEGCTDRGGSRMEVFKSAALGSSEEIEHGALQKLESLEIYHLPGYFFTSRNATQRYLSYHIWPVTKSALFTEVREDCLTNFHSLQTTSQFWKYPCSHHGRQPNTSGFFFCRELFPTRSTLSESYNTFS